MTAPIILFFMLGIVNLAEWRFGLGWELRVASGISMLIVLATLWKIDLLPAIDSIGLVLGVSAFWFVTTLLVASRLREAPTPPHRVVPWQD